MYSKGNQSIWKGRQDPRSVRDVWHQVVKAVDLNEKQSGDVSLLGFCSDVGVKRNFGRVGAVNGPDAIRKAMVNLAVHIEEGFELVDAGNVVVSSENMENAQEELARFVTKIISHNTFPILLGGGHEISYGHAKGVLDQYSDQKVGVINFDPHFDLREYPQGAHSGSWARQLFDEYDNRFHYFPIGINPSVNIAPMFDLMREKEQVWLSMDELLEGNLDETFSKTDYFINQVDHVAVTLDLDVFSSGIAPGVSALNPHGALAHHIKPILQQIFRSKKVTSFDIAEMNPEFDDGRTAKLAAGFIYDIVNLVEESV